MPDHEDRVERVASQIEAMLKAWERKQFSAIVRGATDRQSQDYPIVDRAYRAKRTVLTATIYELSEAIVNGDRE